MNKIEIENKINNNRIPVIDIQNINDNNFKHQLSKEILNACREYGFFYIKNHGIEIEFLNKVDELHKKYLSLPLDVKLQWKKSSNKHDSMGYVKMVEQKTRGILHYKEGSYLNIQGEENRDCSNDSTIFPTSQQELEYDIVGFKDTIEEYIRVVKKLGLKIISIISISLNLPSDYIESNYMKNPSSIIGLFKYPSFDNVSDMESKDKWGICDHTDYTMLTILKQDNVGGLQLKSLIDGCYIDAPTIPNTFICNPGDLLQMLTGNNYLSVYHRVPLNKSGKDRYSIPLFLASDWFTPIYPIKGIPNAPERDLENDLSKYIGYSYDKFYRERINKSFSNTKVLN